MSARIPEVVRNGLKSLVMRKSVMGYMRRDKLDKRKMKELLISNGLCGYGNKNQILDIQEYPLCIGEGTNYSNNVRLVMERSDYYCFTKSGSSRALEDVNYIRWNKEYESHAETSNCIDSLEDYIAKRVVNKRIQNRSLVKGVIYFLLSNKFQCFSKKLVSDDALKVFFNLNYMTNRIEIPPLVATATLSCGGGLKFSKTKSIQAAHSDGGGISDESHGVVKESDMYCEFTIPFEAVKERVLTKADLTAKYP